jgi:hypothetical protein
LGTSWRYKWRLRDVPYYVMIFLIFLWMTFLCLKFNGDVTDSGDNTVPWATPSTSTDRIVPNITSSSSSQGSVPECVQNERGQLIVTQKGKYQVFRYFLTLPFLPLSFFRHFFNSFPYSFIQWFFSLWFFYSFIPSFCCIFSVHFNSSWLTDLILTDDKWFTSIWSTLYRWPWATANTKLWKPSSSQTALSILHLS